MNMVVVWIGISSREMSKFKFKGTTPRLLLFAFLIVSGVWHFAQNGFDEVRPEEIWLGIVLLVALLGSLILKLSVKRKPRE